MEPTDNPTNEDGAVSIAIGALEYPICGTCGSENVVCDAWARWNRITQEWELDQTFDDTFCRDCDADQKVEWKRITETETDRTRRLNDEMRQTILPPATDAYGSVVITHGVNERGRDFVKRALLTVAGFDAFDTDNDPHHEHDFGMFMIEDERLFFKIDYYDLTMQGHSPDKSDVGVTRRVLTIMLASEY